MCEIRLNLFLIITAVTVFNGMYALEEISVIKQILSYETQHTVTINKSVEYILEFRPTGDQSSFPTRVWMSTDGDSVSQPVLITARQAEGAVTWQLPYHSGSFHLSELERTLCPVRRIPAATEYCDPEEDGREQFSLHLSTLCTKQVTINIRASSVRDWRLGFEKTTPVVVTQTRPRVHYFNFTEDKEHVRLILESTDDVCATISVQNYSCPIAETVPEAEVNSLRMTMLRSGAIQLSRSRYPNGFFIVFLVQDTDVVCTGVELLDTEWLWETIWGLQNYFEPSNKNSRIKNITVTLKDSLTRTQFAIAVLVTLAIFLVFYIGFVLLLVARRWTPFHKFFKPRAVLADNNATQNGTGRTEVDGVRDPSRQRRLSDAMFDISEDSDSDEEERTMATENTAVSTTTTSPARSPGIATPQSLPPDTVDAPQSICSEGSIAVNGTNTQVNEVSNTAATPPAHPLGLPPRLRLAALAQRRARVIATRSDRYLYTLATVAVFYALPVVQFVVAFQIATNWSGSLDICYYNFLCANPAGALSDFNHVFSNLGYLMLGGLFVLQLVVRRKRREKKPRHEEYGIPAHHGLLTSLGVCLMMVGLLSATYHICPNGLNFQFDTSFMYVLAVLSMVKMYQSRHPDVNARAHATFGVLAILIALVVWGVLGGGALFWSSFTVLHVLTFLLLSLRIYYLGQFRLEKRVLQNTLSSLRPLYTARMVMLLVANAVNWAFALYAMLTQGSDFATHLLQVLLANTLLYMVFYLVMKLVNGERPRWYSWCSLIGATLAWIPSLYFFLSGSTSWSTTPALSRQINHECLVLQFYDSHDLWHLLSAVALYFTFTTMLTWDDGLSAVKRTEIAVF